MNDIDAITGQDSESATTQVSRGVIHLHDVVVEQVDELRRVLNADNTSIQSELRTSGAFECVHQVLMLPGSYTIVAIYCDWVERQWAIIVESEDIPLNESGGWLPEISPTYRRNEDGSNELADITATLRKRAISFEDLVKAWGWNWRGVSK